MCHISVEDPEELKMPQTSDDVVFTQDRSRLAVIDCGRVMQVANNFLHLRLRLLKLVNGNQRRIYRTQKLVTVERTRFFQSQSVSFTQSIAKDYESQLFKI